VIDPEVRRPAWKFNGIIHYVVLGVLSTMWIKNVIPVSAQCRYGDFFLTKFAVLQDFVHKKGRIRGEVKWDKVFIKYPEKFINIWA
jgi:hypothetical protein